MKTSETPEASRQPRPFRRNRSGDGADEQPFPVVGIGASAGGLEAFTQLLKSLPLDSGMAFLLVQHLDPHHESRLTDLLARATKMPVLEGNNGLTIRPDHVYVIPPNTQMSIAQGTLQIIPRTEGPGPPLPVDHLFRSLALERESRAIGVILSGTGSDGTLGLTEIKASGGITFVQDEKSAKHTGMPRSAIDSGCVDFILAPEEIARRLAEIGRHPYLAPEVENRAEFEAEQQYKKVLSMVRAATGVDFSLYRDTTIRRRIMRRMALHTQQSWAEYLKRLQSDRSEVDALYNDLLINVTSFFRDHEMFEALKTSVYPEIMKRKTSGAQAHLRIWVPGCSTGQEAYSIAMTLVEFCEEQSIRPQIQIFATDLSDQRLLDKARSGVYPESVEAEVPPARLRRFFKREDHVYRVDKSIRDLCVFARQNITVDPPFSHLDLISCRNLLIYLSTPLQKQVLPVFHYALNVPGFLVLGNSETVGEHHDLFALLDRKHKIYTKRPTATRIPMPFAQNTAKGIEELAIRRYGPEGPSQADFTREADRVLLGRYSPPGVLVNEQFDIMQFRGRTSPYLEPPAGEPTNNLLKMAREGLFAGLRSAVTEAQNRGQTVYRKGVRSRFDGRFREVDLEVIPIKPVGSRENSFLILFQEPDGSAQGEVAPPNHVDLPATSEEGEKERIQLRQELAATREYLQSMTEQQEAANEEVRSANEEILSSNEELQSTNEELETAKEELQSANEELTTVNEQLQHRNNELTQVNNDFTNLLSSTSIPVVIVGADLRIRRFTTPARKVMNLLPTDVGRPVGDIRSAINVPELNGLVEQVIATVQPLERTLRDDAGRWHSLRVYPYRTMDNKIDGAVLLFVDIEEQKQAEEKLRNSDRRKDEFLATLSHELRNPLAPIRDALEVMRMAGEGSAKAAQAREVLYRQVRQLSRIVEDLIDFNRIAEKKIHLRMERVPLSEVIKTAMETCRSFIESRQHRLRVTVLTQPIFLHGDPVRLAQILINLLNNAAKFTEPGGEISISAEMADGIKRPSGHEEVIIRVRDTGIGISKSLLPHIFEIFVQAERKSSTQLGGLGVGLTLARSLAQMQGGVLHAQSDGPGRGSEFTLRLPVAPAESGGAEPKPPEREKRRKRILVVDDLQDQARSLGMLLELMGHEVRIAFDGPRALKAASKILPDVILMDIGLPGLNGYDVARRIRRDPKLRGVTLVAQTGWGQGEDRSRRSREAGFDHHLVKPVDIYQLQGIIDGSGRPSKPGRSSKSGRPSKPGRPPSKPGLAKKSSGRPRRRPS